MKHHREHYHLPKNWDQCHSSQEGLAQPLGLIPLMMETRVAPAQADIVAKFRAGLLPNWSSQGAVCQELLSTKGFPGAQPTAAVWNSIHRPGKRMVTQGRARLWSLKVPELSCCIGSDQLG